MELLTSAKQTYLLEAGLEILHEQSNEWLNEIAFWEDEAAFFYSLIVTRTLNSVPEKTKNDLKKTEEDLIDITSSELSDLKNKVTEHEKFLANLVECQDEDQKYYRDKHRELIVIFEQFEKRFKKLKKEVFGLIEELGKNTN